MSLIKLVNGKEIDTTNKTIADVLLEALEDIPMTMVDASKLIDMLEEELKNFNKKGNKDMPVNMRNFEELKEVIRETFNE